MLFFLCAANILLVVFASQELHIDIATTLVAHEADVLRKANLRADMRNPVVLDQLYAMRDAYLIFVGGLSIIITLIFGYIVARIALQPTKDALASQKQFIANIAHELRTPLATVHANNEILLWEAERDSEVSSLARSNIEELDRISGIINNLLTLNAFHSIQRIDFEYVDIAPIIDESVKKYARHIKNKKLIVTESFEKDLYVWGNQNAIGQIVDNILKNAIAYSKNNGRISLRSFSLAHRYAVIQIIDTGIGMAQEKLGRIFEPFFQIDPSRSKVLSSSGLGLAIVNELIKLHHGAIDIRSILNEGTTVEVRLPLEPKKTFSRYSHKKHEGNDTISLNFTELT